MTKKKEPVQILEADRPKIEKQIKEIVGDLAGIRSSRLKASVNLRNELGIDSFTALEIVVAIEKEFGMLIGEKQIARLITFQDLIDYVCTNQNKSVR